MNICSLSLLVIKTSPHGTLVATLVLQKILQEIKQIVPKNVKENWSPKEILKIVKRELGAHEARTTKPVEDGKNDSGNFERFRCTWSSLLINYLHRSQGQIKFFNIKRVYRSQVHWYDKFSFIMDPNAREKI